MYEKNLEIGYLLDFYGDILTEKQRNIVDLYYNQDLSLAEISEHVRMTRQGVRDSIKRSGEIMLNLENKLGFSKQSNKYRESFEIIIDCVRAVKDSKEESNHFKIVDENVDKIIDTIKNVLS